MFRLCAMLLTMLVFPETNAAGRTILHGKNVDFRSMYICFPRNIRLKSLSAQSKEGYLTLQLLK